MKHQRIIQAFVLVLILAASCGTSAKRTLSNYEGPHNTVTVSGKRLDIYIDDHTRSRKNADQIFNDWSERAHLKRNITGKRLMSIAPKADGCHLTYDFRLTDGTQQRVTLIVEDYTNTYRKRHRQTNAAYVNGRKYNFNH